MKESERKKRERETSALIKLCFELVTIKAESLFDSIKDSSWFE